MGVAEVRRKDGKVVVEFTIEEYYMLLNILREVSMFVGTGTGLRARSLLQKLERKGREGGG